MNTSSLKDLKSPPEVAEPTDVIAPATIATIRKDRIVLDSERFVSSVDHECLDSSDPLASEWSQMRQTIAVFPLPNGERGPLAEALLRDEVEYSAETIASHTGCRWIVDKRLESLFDMESEPVEMMKTTIETGCPASPQIAPSVSWSRAFLQRLSGRTPRAASDWIEIEPGTVTTSVGGTRVNSECVTSVFHEAGSNDRIDLRIISERRTVRLRFDSRNDPRFLAFWPRWRAEPRSDSVSASSA
ncbi:MAG: hypothetical protein GWP75_07345 [Planctomycetia bacterium]|nr:hypothetical protein [Planctomycetia bacterium]